MNILHIREDCDIRVGFQHWVETDLALSEVLQGLKRLDIRADNLKYIFESVSMALNPRYASHHVFGSEFRPQLGQLIAGFFLGGVVILLNVILLE